MINHNNNNSFYDNNKINGLSRQYEVLKLYYN